MLRETTDWPLFLFIYNIEGYHDNGIRLESENDLNVMQAEILTAINNGQEVRITDREDYLVFHAKDRRIVWPEIEENKLSILP